MHSILRFFNDFNRKNTTLIIGGIMVVIFAFVALFAPLLELHDPTYMQAANQFIAPCLEYPFGTDNLGRCIFSRVIEGSRISLVTATLVVLFGAMLGTAIGLVSGFAGGKIDGFLMRVTDVFLAFPTIVFALAVSAVLGTGEINLIIALMCIHWTRYARLARGEIVLLRNEECIESARAIGNSSLQIAFRYLVPSVASKIIVMMSLDLGSVVLFCSSLSFLGLGAQPPSPDWGAMISDGREYLRFAPWMSFFPGLAIAICAIGFNLLGDGIRDLTDPRMREHAVTE
ncbi:MAG: ABC transporter permease [Eggerthellaceae bacterium]|nr:ABC transporter permease [Eggerthellaceae bacterium]